MDQTVGSAYLHVPFCRHRCGYCNFTLITGRDDLIGEFLNALELEISSRLTQPCEVDTLFIGGGTPSYLAGPALERLLRIANTWFPRRSGGEFSCEVNPLDCDDARLSRFRAAGVNRISVGGQSFATSKLKWLERDHTGDELSRALDLCAVWFPSISLDLIFAAAQETIADWQLDLQRALASPISHLSTYGLTIERGAAFFGRLLKNEFTEVDEDLQCDMYKTAIDTLASAGWEHYEVSSFARPGHRCRHNEAYWLAQPWWAFGPGAVSFLPAGVARRGAASGERADGDAGSMCRTLNHRSTTTYIRRLLEGRTPVAEREFLNREDQLRERLVFGLRRLEGVSLPALEAWWGGPIGHLFEPYLQRYLAQGFLESIDTEQLRLTRRGLLISDSLWPDLLVSSSVRSDRKKR